MCSSFALLSLGASTWRLVEHLRSGYESQSICQQIGLYIFIKFREGLFDVAVGELLVVVHIERGVCIDFHEPDEPVFVDQDVEAKYLEAPWVRMVCAHEAMVRIL